MKKGLKVIFMLALVTALTIVGGTTTKAKDITLKDGKWTKGVLTGNTDHYYKINVKKTGYIKAEFKRDDENGDGDFEICSNRKKVIAKCDSSLGYEYIAVKKGTYYLHITAYPDFEEHDDDENITENYKVRYKFTAFKDSKKSVTMKKAVSLKKNKEVQGLVFAGKLGKYDIGAAYKYVAKGKEKITIKAEISPGAMMQITNSKGTILSVKDGHLKYDKSHISWFEGKGSETVTLDKGTYYFVFRYISIPSGYYKLKIQ